MPTPPSKPLLTTRAARHALLTPTPAHRRQIPPDSDATHGTALDKEEYRGETHVSLRGAPSAHPPLRPGSDVPRQGRPAALDAARALALPARPQPPLSAHAEPAGTASHSHPSRRKGRRGEGAARRGRPSAGRDEQRQHGNGDAPARCGSPARGPAPPRSSGARAAPGRATRPAQPQLPQGHPPAPRPWPGCGSRRGEQAGGAGTRTRDRSRPHSAHAQHGTAALPAPPLKGPLRGGN